MNKALMANKIKALSHLSRVEKTKMNEWMLKKAEILHKISIIDSDLLEIDKKMKHEDNASQETMVYLETYSRYIAEKKEQLCSQKKKLVSELDKAQENLSLYFTQHKTYENLQHYTLNTLDSTVQKEQRDILDDIATLGYSRKKTGPRH